MGKVILVTGGARSGKSSYAQTRAESLPGPRTFIATCPHIDGEMDERIQKHIDERSDRNWQTVEEEIDLSGALTRCSSNVVLIDCLTLWVNNLVYIEEQKGNTFGEDDMRSLCLNFLYHCEKYEGSIFCVTNEVGSGIVPENSSARRYRDLVGRCNQVIGAQAHEVIFVSCGIPLTIKG